MANNCNNNVDSSKPVDYEVFLPFTKLIYRISESHLCPIKFPEIWMISCKNSVECWLPKLRNTGFSSNFYFLVWRKCTLGSRQPFSASPSTGPAARAPPTLSVLETLYISLRILYMPFPQSSSHKRYIPKLKVHIFSSHSRTSGLKCRHI